MTHVRSPDVRPVTLDPLHRLVLLQVPNVNRVAAAGGHDGLGVGGVRLVDVKAEREAARRWLQRLEMLKVPARQRAIRTVRTEDLGMRERDCGGGEGRLANLGERVTSAGLARAPDL